MTAIDAAWQAVERGDPTALRQCVRAMCIARDVLAEFELSEDEGPHEQLPLDGARA